MQNIYSFLKAKLLKSFKCRQYIKYTYVDKKLHLFLLLPLLQLLTWLVRLPFNVCARKYYMYNRMPRWIQTHTHIPRVWIVKGWRSLGGWLLLSGGILNCKFDIIIKCILYILTSVVCIGRVGNVSIVVGLVLKYSNRIVV